MTMHFIRRSDIDSRVEQLADRLGLTGSERKTETIERALALLEERVVYDQPSRAAIEATLDRYIDSGARLRERLAHLGDNDRPLSASLQRALYDDIGLPE